MSEPLTEDYPCTVCQGTARWLDKAGTQTHEDVWRCKACWPSALTKKAQTWGAKWRAVVEAEEQRLRAPVDEKKVASHREEAA